LAHKRKSPTRESAAGRPSAAKKNPEIFRRGDRKTNNPPNGLVQKAYQKGKTETKGLFFPIEKKPVLLTLHGKKEGATLSQFFLSFFGCFRYNACGDVGLLNRHDVCS
jgi:hypothetical protein